MEVKKIELYNGEVTIEYEDSKHLYTDHLGPIPGVTSVLGMIDKSGLVGWESKPDYEKIRKGGLVNWAVRTDLEYVRSNWGSMPLEELLDNASVAHEASREDSAEFGTHVHNCLESYIKTGSYEAGNDEAERRVYLLKRWQGESGASFLDSERVVYSKAKRYCGTTDAIVEWKDKTYVADFKTNSVHPYSKRSGIYLTYWLQTAAYQAALEEELETQFDGRIIFRLGEDGLELGVSEERGEYLRHLEGFRSALNLYNLVNEHDKK